MVEDSVQQLMMAGLIPITRCPSLARNEGTPSLAEEGLQICPLFEEHGHVLEVALIKDKRTGQQEGCCFVKFATSEEADRAMTALHNQHTLPGGVGPIQVSYADRERERLGAVEYKLFVGALNKQATEKEVQKIFSPYGRVEEVYLMGDEMKQSHGCGFVKFFHREMAMAAINALNGIYTMKQNTPPLMDTSTTIIAQLVKAHGRNQRNWHYLNNSRNNLFKVLKPSPTLKVILHSKFFRHSKFNFKHSSTICSSCNRLHYHHQCLSCSLLQDFKLFRNLFDYIMLQYQASGVTVHLNIQELGYTQLQMAAGSVNDPAHFTRASRYSGLDVEE